MLTTVEFDVLGIWFSFLYAITQFPLFIHVYVIEFIWPNFCINTNNHSIASQVYRNPTATWTQAECLDARIRFCGMSCENTLWWAPTFQVTSVHHPSNCKLRVHAPHDRWIKILTALSHLSLQLRTFFSEPLFCSSVFLCPFPWNSVCSLTSYDKHVVTNQLSDRQVFF